MRRKLITVISARIDFSRGFQYRFCVNRDVDQIRNHNPASIERPIPAYSELLAIDSSPCQESGAGLWTFVDPVFPPGCLPFPQVGHAQIYFAGHSTDS